MNIHYISIKCPKCGLVGDVDADRSVVECQCGYKFAMPTKEQLMQELPLPPIEEEARKLITGDRRDAYGEAKQSFDNLALIWTGIIRAKTKAEVTLDGPTVALMMSAFKLCREANKHKRDNLVDGIAYIQLADQITPK